MLFFFRVRNWSSGKPMSVWNCKIMPNTDLYREKKGDWYKTQCEQQIKNKNQGTKKKKKKSCFLGLPREKRPILSQRFTVHTAWFHSRKITSGFSWCNAWWSQAWTSLGPSLHGAPCSANNTHTWSLHTGTMTEQTSVSFSPGGKTLRLTFLSFQIILPQAW